MNESVLDWSLLHAGERVERWVTEQNEPARRLYDRCGFVPSGKRQPLPSDASVQEIQWHAFIDPCREASTSGAHIGYASSLKSQARTVPGSRRMSVSSEAPST
jgi:RimJ/RimL family protein N-acetyltransferase